MPTGNASGKIIYYGLFFHISHTIYIGNVSPNSLIACPKEFISSSVASWGMENGMLLRDIIPRTSSIIFLGAGIGSIIFFNKLIVLTFLSDVIVGVTFFHWRFEHNTLLSSHHSKRLKTKISYAMSRINRVAVGMTCNWSCSNNFVQIMM